MCVSLCVHVRTIPWWRFWLWAELDTLHRTRTALTAQQVCPHSFGSLAYTLRTVQAFHPSTDSSLSHCLPGLPLESIDSIAPTLREMQEFHPGTDWVAASKQLQAMWNQKAYENMHLQVGDVVLWCRRRLCKLCRKHAENMTWLENGKATATIEEELTRKSEGLNFWGSSR